MRSRSSTVGLLLLTGALAGPAGVTGCFQHHAYGERVGFTWTETERPYYSRWESETKRDHREWNDRSHDDQQAYAEWRSHHNQ